jgi:HDOD domain
MQQDTGNSSRLDEWVERINARDMKTMTATVKRVQSIVGNDRSSLQALTEALESDPELSEKILRIMNTPMYLTSPDPVTSVSRAATVIGFDAIRNICITNRILESLMGTEGTPQTVQYRLLRRTAASLHAAVQARSLLREAPIRVREEAFLAALFEQIGESTFWSLGSEEALTLDRVLRKSDVDIDGHATPILGGTFRDLSAALTRSWGIGGVEDMSSHETASGLTLPAAIRLGNDIADCVVREGWHSSRLQRLMPRIGVALGIDESDAERLVRNAGTEAENMAHCYGVGTLARRMSYQPSTEHRLLESHNPGNNPNAQPSRIPAKPKAAPGSADFSVQQTVLNQMKTMLASDPDINAMMQTAMDGVQRGIGMDRTVVGLLSEDRRHVRTRFFLGEDGERWSKQFRFDVPVTKSLMRECVNDYQLFHYNAQEPGAVAKLVPVEMMRFCGGKDFMIAPILVKARCIGVIYADRFFCDVPISQGDFDAFSKFAQQLRICLGVIAQRRP